MPSGIFPAVFEELGSKCCFEGLSSEPIFNHVEFDGSLDGVDSGQHLPGTSFFSQKSFFKGLKVSSGTKARIRWKKSKEHTQFGAGQTWCTSCSGCHIQGSVWEQELPPDILLLLLGHFEMFLIFLEPLPSTRHAQRESTALAACLQLSLEENQPTNTTIFNHQQQPCANIPAPEYPNPALGLTSSSKMYRQPHIRL